MAGVLGRLRKAGNGRPLRLLSPRSARQTSPLFFAQSASGAARIRWRKQMSAAAAVPCVLVARGTLDRANEPSELLPGSEPSVAVVAALDDSSIVVPLMVAAVAPPLGKQP